MLTLRPSDARGKANFGWLNSHHSFSFGSYYDPRFMGFASLRVINEDWIAGGGGFPTHGHSDMEIVTYVLEGALEHRDSLGNGAVMRYGDVQRMTAGTGIRHSEFNASTTEPVHLLQIWLLPGEAGLTPSYEQTYFEPESKQNHLRLIGSPTGEAGSVVIHQDVNLYASILAAGKTVAHNLSDNRVAWLQVARGGITVNGQALQAGDGLAIQSATPLAIQGTEDSEFLLFDMAA
ncbi:MAG: pirin family protein [Synechococcaceae cyanobacterium SM2_3_60]|nr:pirin family protein [Synechococcaceae cyanobacterium SM2_3_60]